MGENGSKQQVSAEGFTLPSKDLSEKNVFHQKRLPFSTKGEG
jgi:hypothetical protein